MLRTSNLLRSILAIVTYACMGILVACSTTRSIGQQQSVSDTVQIQIVSVDKIEGAELLPVGGSIQIPDLDIEIVRFSETEAIVKTQVRREVRTDFVPVRQVNKSRTKIDNSVRTDTDIDVRTKDKSRTKEVDKSRTNSGNRTKTKEKTVDKDLTRNGFPWWIIILAIAIGGISWTAKRFVKLPWMK